MACHFYNKIFLFFILALVSFSGCKKEPFSGTPFYEILDGYWALDTFYTINSETFRFDEYDFNFTQLVFHKNKGIEANCREFIRLNGKFMSIVNEHGLILASNEHISGVPKLLGADKVHTNSLLKELWNASPYIVMKDNYCNFKDCIGDPKAQDCIRSLKKHINFNQIRYFLHDKIEISPEKFHLNDIGPRYEMHQISGNEIELVFFNNYYQRVIDGVPFLDVIKFRIKKSGLSDILNVKPFHPDNYSKSWWQNFSAATSGLKLHGGATIKGNGIRGNCLYLNGNKQYAEFPRKLFAPITLSFWIKPENLDKQRQIIYSKYSNIYGPYILSLEKDKFVLEVNDGHGNLQKIVSALPVVEDEWNHICLTVDQMNYANLYVNSELDGRGTINSLNNDALGTILLGVSEKDLNTMDNIYFQGCLDEFIFFNDVFSSIEVKLLYLWHKQ